MQKTTAKKSLPAAPSRPGVIVAIKATPNADKTDALAYRVADFCARIGISASTFWKLVSEQKIRVIRIGGRTLVPADEAARILREGVQ